MADLSTYEGRQAARDAGNWVGKDDSGNIVSEPGHPGGQANLTTGGNPGSPSNNSGDPSLSGYVAAMAASSGFSIKQLEEQKREFDATLEWQKQQWREQGLPELAIKQRAQDLEDQKFAELQRSALVSEQLQTRAADLDEKIKTGQLSLAQAKQAFDEEMGRGQLGVSQGQLGLDTLKTAASLSGPENWIQASNFARGVQGNPNLSGFVSQLMSGQSTATMGGPQPGAQMSNPLSMGGMAAGLTGQPQPGQQPQWQQGTPYAPGTRDPNAPQQPYQPGAAQPYLQQMGPQTLPTAPMANPQWAQPGAISADSSRIQQYQVQPGGVQPVPMPAVNGTMTPEQIQQRMLEAQQRFQVQPGGVQPVPMPTVNTGAPPAGFWTTIAGGQKVFTPSAPGAVGGAAAQPAAGGTTRPGAMPQGDQRWTGATGADVARMFGRPDTQPAGWGGDTTAAQSQMRKLFAQGGQALGPQQMEGLTETERKMMEGGGAALGADVEGFKEQYARSRIGQSASKPGSFSGM